jgi:hypothetical protein
MEFRPVTPTDYELLRQFLSEVGWQHRVSDAEQFNKMMENTNRLSVRSTLTICSRFALTASKDVGAPFTPSRISINHE